MNSSRDNFLIFLGALTLLAIISGSSFLSPKPITAPGNSSTEGISVLTNKESPDKSLLAAAPIPGGQNLYVQPQNISTDTLKPLLNSLQGFGSLFPSTPAGNIGNIGQFLGADKAIVDQVQQIFGGQGSNLALSEECGLPGGAFKYPPGSDDFKTACGGTPGFGGTMCGTVPVCYYSGKCYYIPYLGCQVQSCYGKCKGSGGLSLSSLGSGLISGLGSNLLSGVSSGLLSNLGSSALSSLGSSALSGLGSSALSSLGSGVLSGLGSNLTSGLSSGLLNGLGSSALSGLTGSLGSSLGSSILNQVGGSAIQSIASQLGVNLSQGAASQISSIIQRVAGGAISNLSSNQQSNLGNQIGQSILKNVGSAAISSLAKQAGSALASQMGQQALSGAIDKAIQSGGGGGVGYIWDSITHSCGCAGTPAPTPSESCQSSQDAINNYDTSNTPDPILTPEQSQDFANGTNFTGSSGADTVTTVNGVGFSGTSNPNGPTVLFDNTMTQAQKDQWMADNQKYVSCGTGDQYVYVAQPGDYGVIARATNLRGDTCGFNTSGAQYPGDGSNESFSGTVVNNGTANCGETNTVAHELGHGVIDQCLGNSMGENDPFLQQQLENQKQATDACSAPITDYSLTGPSEFGAENFAKYCESGGTYQPQDPQTAQIYNNTIDYMKSNGCIK